MDWAQVISALAGALAGGGLVRLATLGSARRKAGAEADSAAVAAMREAYDAMKDALSEIRESNDRFLAAHTRDEAAMAEKDSRALGLAADNAALEMLACRHDACPFREPAKGLGAEWWKGRKGSGERLTDTESIQSIGRRLGYSVKRLPARDNGGTDTERGKDGGDAGGNGHGDD